MRVPENELSTLEAVEQLPVMGDGEAQQPLLSDVATVRTGEVVGEVDHYNSQRTLTITANLAGDDLGGTAVSVERAISSLGTPPKGVTVTVRGQAAQLRTALAGLNEGLALAVFAVLLLLTANFQSVREALIALSTVPAVLAGAVLALSATHTSLNVQSMMGTIMAIGVSVANAVLLVTFAHERWRGGATRAEAAIAAATVRVRPIVMTSLAMIVGMAPTALALGEGAAQAAPLGVAVIGGLLGSTAATLLIVPAIFVIVGSRGAAASPSLHPEEVSS